ncbi:MAG: class I SAM-dependent methyltransferase [Pedosphaera sp.]|nr:class I SAM-dependent methyltransferase [Pedosphaera sp.]
MSANAPDDLQRIYEARFNVNLDYRRAVWRVLIDDFFQRYVAPEAAVLDLGCGYGEFINQIRCGKRYAMDLNPDMPRRVEAGVNALLQDCSTEWQLPENSLDVVFTSNFFEHLPDKPALGRTLDQAHRCLKPGGRLIALGPNTKYLPGTYWDFWDHYLPLTELSLREALVNRKFSIESCVAKFLPYTMAGGRQYPMFFVRAFLKLKPAWRVLGKQFLVVAVK